jgi:hypothetical protein
MDRASDYGSEGWGFDSLPARFRSALTTEGAHLPEVLLELRYRGVRKHDLRPMSALGESSRLLRMDGLVPFCEECGDPRVMISGMHPGDAGLVRWAIYGCGHTRTEIVMEAVPSDGEPDLLPVVPPSI